LIAPLAKKSFTSLMMLWGVTIMVKVTDFELMLRTLSNAVIANVFGPRGNAVSRLMARRLWIGLPPTVPLPFMVGVIVPGPDPVSVTLYLSVKVLSCV